MPAVKRSTSTTSARMTTGSSRPRGRPATKVKVKKSNQFIDDEAEEVIGASSDDDAKSVKSSKASQSEEEEDVSVSTPITPTRRGRSAASTSILSKRTASALTPPGSDAEEADVQGTPKKQRLTPVQKVLRFKGSAQKVTPIKPTTPKQKSPRVRKAPSEDGEIDDVFVEKNTPKGKVKVIPDVEESEDTSNSVSVQTTGKSKTRPVPKAAIPVANQVKASKGSGTSRSTHLDSDDGEPLAGFEIDSDEEAVHLTDQVTSLEPPETDESDVGTRDQALLRSYEGLDNIRVACMHSWSDRQGDGHPTYSGIRDTLTNLNRRVHKEAIIFDQNGNVGNISRTSPSLVSTGAGKSYFHMLGGGIKPMMFTSVIVVNESFLEQPKISGNGKMFKVIDGALHAGEYERLVGAIGMIIGEKEFRGQLLMDNLSFTTAFGTSGSGSSPAKHSPFTRTAGSSSYKTTLGCHDIIPVWDAVGDKKFAFNKMIPNILVDPTLLPRFRGEVPSGSCAVVGYTVNTFKKADDLLKSVSFNVHFVIVLGTP